MKSFLDALKFYKDVKNARGDEMETSPSYPRVDQDMAVYRANIKAKREAFNRFPEERDSIVWIRKKLEYMVELDQYTRNFMDVVNQRSYAEDEKTYFFSQFGPLWQAIDQENTMAVKELLQDRNWFVISEYGEAADWDAWLIVQHADHDPAFQRDILERLEKLWPIGETNAKNYAYLFDRVAVAQGQPQRYGTQGQCVGPGQWQPFPLEEPDQVDQRRAAVGLGPLRPYVESFQELCK